MEVAEIQNKNSWYKSQISTLKQDKNEKRIPIENVDFCFISLNQKLLKYILFIFPNEKTKKRILGLNEKKNLLGTHRTRLDEELAKWEKELSNAQTEKVNNLAN